MRTKELNLCEILKGRENIEIYCVLFGYGKISEINNDFLIVQDKHGVTWYFEPNGKYADDNCENGECLLFPSKENRDWSTFKSKVERFDPKTLKPFDKVLVRDYDEDEWRVDIFDSIRHGIRKDSIRCIGRTWYKVVPYNDYTKHLIGTTDEAPEYYRYWK